MWYSEDISKYPVTETFCCCSSSHWTNLGGSKTSVIGREAYEGVWYPSSLSILGLDCIASKCISCVVIVFTLWEALGLYRWFASTRLSSWTLAVSFHSSSDQRGWNQKEESITIKKTDSMGYIFCKQSAERNLCLFSNFGKMKPQDKNSCLKTYWTKQSFRNISNFPFSFPLIICRDQN